MNIFSKRRKEIEITSSLRKYYSKQAASQTPHCARNYWSEGEKNNKQETHSEDKTMMERQRFLRHRCGHVCIPHIGNSALVAEILSKKKR